MLQCLGVLLESNKGLALGVALAEANAAQAVVADDAAPASIVEVENQAFLAQAQLGRQQRGHAETVVDDELRGAGHLGMKEITIVTPEAASSQGRQAVDVMQHDMRRRVVGQGVVHPAYKTPETCRMPHLVIVHLAPCRPVETVLHDQATQAVMDRVPEGRPVGQFRIDQGSDLRAAEVKGRPADQIAPTRSQQHDVGLKAV